MFNSVTDGEYRKRAVLSFLARQVPGGKNLFMDQINDLNLPNIDNPEFPFNENARDEKISLEDMFKSDTEDQYRGFFSYINYEGSLTGPPCDEFVSWYISYPPIEVGFTLH